MKKKIFGSLVAVLLVIAMMPMVFAVDTGASIGVSIGTEDFAPMIWMDPTSRLVLDDNVEPGRQQGSVGSCVVGDAGNGELCERQHNYAFEGEQIVWDVLVMDKNGIEKIRDVFVTVSPVQDASSADIEANCQISSLLGVGADITAFNARLDEEYYDVVPYDNTFAEYTCTLTVETPDSMYGEYWVAATVEDLDGLTNSFDENEYWFLNPTIALDLSGVIDFGVDIRPGTARYSDTITVGNDADLGSGVMLEMFISGTDFYDTSNSGAKCPTTNQLALNDPTSPDDNSVSNADPFAYFATNGAYSTATQNVGIDAEGYAEIPHGNNIRQAHEIIGEDSYTAPSDAGYAGDPGNVLSPGNEMSVTFRLFLPEPCNGDFDSGQIFFWGEAI
jgi:hypothetical protein